jgi:membrane protein implicated in regulation of membrane protease activity
MQSKINSFIESLANTASGFLVSFGVSFLVYPLLGMEGSASAYAVAGMVFTVISIARNYVVRRVFNWKYKT